MRQPENVSAVDDDCVGRRQVEAALDNRGGEQNLILALVKSAHPLLDFACTHLAMRGDDFDFRHMLAQPFLNAFHIGNARHDDEALPAAMMFAQQSLAHHHIVPLHHIGPHC